MEKFMKKHTLLVKSKKLLALLLAVAMVTGGLPATTVSAAETSVTDEAGVSVDPASNNEVAAEGSDQTGGTGDGEDSNLIQYSIDTTEFIEILEDWNCAPVAQYGSRELANRIGNWTSSWLRGYYIHVLKNGEELCRLQDLNSTESVNYEAKWQVKKGEEFVDLEAAPDMYSPAGTYKLLIEIPAVEGVSAAASEGVLFEITPAELTVNATFGEDDGGVEPGTKVKDVVMNVSASAKVYKNSNSYKTVKFIHTNDAETSQLNVNLAVVDAYSGETLKDDFELRQDGDYYAKLTVSFTDNVTEDEKASFTFPTATSEKLQMSGLIETYVNIQMTDKWKNDNETPDNADDDYYENYTTTFDGEDVEAPAEKVDYTMEIRYWDSFDAEKNEDVWTTITPEEGEVTYQWYDPTNSVWLDAAPVDAGSYIYYIKYAGKAGLYASASAGIPVIVEPKELTLAPKWKGDTAPTFYPGMSEEDVLDYIDYDAVDESGAVVEIDRDHIWGTRSSSNRTYSYKPVFELQIETVEGEGTENEKKVYLDNDGDTLQYETYRVAFSGDKAIYYLDGRVYRTRSINDTNGDAADTNYVVNVEEEVLEAKVLPVTVAAGTAAQIDASALLVNGAGVSMDKPITKTYDGTPFYMERSEYKVAKVVEAANTGNVIAEGVDSSIVYTWWALNEGATGDAANDWRQLDAWSDVEDWMNYRNSPIDAGIYRLVISYSDPANVYHAASATVYYEVEPQRIKVVPTSVPSALTETDADDYAYDEITYEIRAVSSHDGADASHDGGDSAVLELTEGVDYRIGRFSDDNDGWGIEEATAETPNEYNEFDGVFTKGNSYRVAVTDFYLYKNVNGISNYIDYEEVVEKEGDTETTVKEYFHETAPIELLNMGTEELVITVDKTKLSATSKVYDGVAWDLSADIANGLVKVTKKSDGSAVTDIELDYRWEYKSEGGFTTSFDYAQYSGGTYTIYASYAGDVNYRPAEEVEVATVTIEPKDITAEVVVGSPVVAGTTANDNFDAMNVVFEGVVDRDSYCFNYAYYYDFMGMDSWSFVVKDAKGNTVDYWNDMLRGNTTYTVEFDGELDSIRSTNYNLTSKVTTFTTVRGNATVEAISFDGIEKATIADVVKGMEHTIKPTAAVPYSYEQDGNYVAFRIDRPKEYKGSDYSMMYDASYMNSIEAAGGEVLYSDAGTIFVVFDVSAKDSKTFSICWEPGYVENFTVDFTNALLMANMEEAVAPKSISIISPAKKMAVGEAQQLDVKLTKKEMADVIYLGYSVDNNDVLCVDEEGYVTALATGKATVTVFPARYNFKTGKAVAIEGAKTAKVTITVTDVSAPKISKVQAWDDYARVNWGAVKDGARREIYVLEGKKLTAADFEEKIAAMEQQHWENFFVTEPDYSTAKYATYTYIYDLKPNTDYTVYVRNVSATRTLADGCDVATSVKGSVKSFKTTKSQVEALSIYYNEKQPVTYNQYYDRLEVALTKKNVTVSAEGIFWENAYNSAADEWDAIVKQLPLTGTDKKSYVSPKLTYFVADRTEDLDWDNVIIWDGGAASQYDSDDGNYYYFEPTSLAKISKSGKMSLKGAGTVWVAVGDTVSGVISEWQPLTITVNPNKMTANKVNLQVGQSKSLANMVTYYEGKTKLFGSFSKNLVLTEEAKQAINASEYFKLNAAGTRIIAIKAGGKLDNLTVKDVYWNLETNVSIKSADLTPVKSLKATMVVDKYAEMSFTYTGTANKIRVEAIDASGRVVDGALYDKSDLYDSENKVYRFTVDGLTKQSKYTVQVTALYDDENGVCVESKVVKKAIKTTKVPVSYRSLGKYEYGGSSCYVYAPAGDLGQNMFYTGNTYTLYMYGDNDTAADSLIWTSTNKKVATVKANGGSGMTYTATFKALRQGTTDIEVKSKITKQVIARYSVSVDAVGNANFYYGDEQALQSVASMEAAE